MICFVANTAAYCPTTRRRYIFHLQRYTFLAVPQTFSPYYYLQKQNTHDNRKKYIHPQCFCQTLKMLLPKPTTIATMPRSFAAGVRIPRSPASRPVPRSSTAGLVHPTSSSYISLPTPRQPSPHLNLSPHLPSLCQESITRAIHLHFLAQSENHANHIKNPQKPLPDHHFATLTLPS